MGRHGNRAIATPATHQKRREVRAHPLHVLAPELGRRAHTSIGFSLAIGRRGRRRASAPTFRQRSGTVDIIGPAFPPQSAARPCRARTPKRQQPFGNLANVFRFSSSRGPAAPAPPGNPAVLAKNTSASPAAAASGRRQQPKPTHATVSAPRRNHLRDSARIWCSQLFRYRHPRRLTGAFLCSRAIACRRSH